MIKQTVIWQKISRRFNTVNHFCKQTLPESDRVIVDIIKSVELVASLTSS